MEDRNMLYKLTVYTRTEKKPNMLLETRGFSFTVLVLWLLNLFNVAYTTFYL